MPEGPEVRIITGWIRSKIHQKYLLGIFHDYNSKFFKKGGIEGITLINSLFPIYISDVFCKGKHIYICLQKDNIKYYIYNHLNMEGHWRLDRKWRENGEITMHSNLWMKVGSQQSDKELFADIFDIFFDDSRKFGKFAILTESEYQNRIKNELGPDLLNENVPWDLYHKRIKDIMSRVRTKNIADYLLDQKYFCGIGNYLKSEILYHARINPFRLLSSLNDQEIYALYLKSIEIIQLAYQQGGMTIKTYKNPFLENNNGENNDNGGFIPCVYGRKLDDYDNQVIAGKSKQKKTDRTTYWVPTLQK